MSLRNLTECVALARYSLINLIAFKLHLLVLAYLLFSSLLAGIRASPAAAVSSAQSKHSSQSLAAPDERAVTLDKRAAPNQYNFGLGKKWYDSGDSGADDSYSLDELDELKRADPNRFSFGLGKKSTYGDHRFGFGLGKRATEGRFQFGLGKRAAAIAPRDRFAFGLGKREFEDYMKRRYSFGLGKRQVSPLDGP